MSCQPSPSKSATQIPGPNSSRLMEIPSLPLKCTNLMPPVPVMFVNSIADDGGACAFKRGYLTRDFSSFEDLVAHFLRQGAKSGGQRITAAGFGVAGAVVEGRLHANNMPWTLNPSELARRLDVSLEDIVLLNDVVATAWGLDQLPAEDLAILNQGV